MLLIALENTVKRNESSIHSFSFSRRFIYSWLSRKMWGFQFFFRWPMFSNFKRKSLTLQLSKNSTLSFYKRWYSSIHWSTKKVFCPLQVSVWGDFSQLKYADSENYCHFAPTRQLVQLLKYLFLPKFCKNGRIWTKTEIMIRVKVEILGLRNS